LSLNARFSLQARNNNIDGYSEAAQILATPRTPPTDPPLDLTVASVTTASVFLTWQPPAGYVAGSPSVTKYLLEGCGGDCGSDDPFPPQAAIGTTHFVAGGAEYKWTGIEWSATGVTNWRVIATVPFYTVSFNVTALDGRALEVMHNYQFRVSAGNLNSRSFGPAAVVTRAMPVPPPGPAREVVVSNPRITQFALNFVPPLVTNITGPSTMYRVMVTETVTGYTYEYHEVLTVTSTLASGFLPGTSYTVTIFAGNLGGFDKIGSRSTRFVKTLATPCTTACCEVPPPSSPY
jgi:hypothetical protein